MQLRGSFEAVDTGGAAKHVVLGFGSGAAELRTAVEGCRMTEQGLRRLGSGTPESRGGKMPGIAAPLGVAVTTGNPIGLIVMSAVVLTTPLGAQQDETALAKKTQTPVADLVEG